MALAEEECCSASRRGPSTRLEPASAARPQRPRSSHQRVLRRNSMQRTTPCEPRWLSARRLQQQSGLERTNENVQTRASCHVETYDGRALLRVPLPSLLRCLLTAIGSLLLARCRLVSSHRAQSTRNPPSIQAAFESIELISPPPHVHLLHSRAAGHFRRDGRRGGEHGGSGGSRQRRAKTSRHHAPRAYAACATTADGRATDARSLHQQQRHCSHADAQRRQPPSTESTRRRR